MEATKNICCVKGEGAIYCSTLTRWFKKFCSECKSLDDLTRSNRPKTVDSESHTSSNRVNPVSIIQRVSGKFTISQSSVDCHLHRAASNYQNIAKLLTQLGIW